MVQFPDAFDSDFNKEFDAAESASLDEKVDAALDALKKSPTVRNRLRTRLAQFEESLAKGAKGQSYSGVVREAITEACARKSS